MGDSDDEDEDEDRMFVIGLESTVWQFPNNSCQHKIKATNPQTYMKQKRARKKERKREREGKHQLLPCKIAKREWYTIKSRILTCIVMSHTRKVMYVGRSYFLSVIHSVALRNVTSTR